MAADPAFTPGGIDRIPGGIDRIYDAQQANRARVAGTTAAERIEKLHRLERALFAHHDEIRAALWSDYRKPPAEVDLSEIYPVVG